MCNFPQVRARVSFRSRNVQFSASSRKSAKLRGGIHGYAAQVILPIDAEIVEKGHFWAETDARPAVVKLRARVSFRSRNVQFSASSRKSAKLRGGIHGYAAQVILPIDAEIVEKGHFWAETDARPAVVKVRARVSFRSRNVQFSASSRKSAKLRGGIHGYAAQVILPIDAEIVEKGHFWAETSFWTRPPAPPS